MLSFKIYKRRLKYAIVINFEPETLKVIALAHWFLSDIRNYQVLCHQVSEFMLERQMSFLYKSQFVHVLLYSTGTNISNIE